MSTIVRGLGMLAVCTGLLVSGCAGDDGEGMGDTGGSDGSSTGAPEATTAMTTAAPEDTGSSDGGEGSSGEDGPPPADSSGGGGGSTDDGNDADSGGSETGSEVVWDEDFVWVADFLRTNCVQCHATNVNGNLLLPSADMTNDEVRLALDGVDATTGLKLVEPGDREASQTWLQITNEFGAQFPVEDTDRFGDWIDAGASYFAP